MKHMTRYHEKREKNNVAVKKFRKDKSVKDLGKMKQLELVRMVMIWKMPVGKQIQKYAKNISKVDEDFRYLCFSLFSKFLYLYLSERIYLFISFTLFLHG